MPDDCANSVGRLAEGLALRAYRLRALRVIHRSLGERASGRPQGIGHRGLQALRRAKTRRSIEVASVVAQNGCKGTRAEVVVDAAFVVAFDPRQINEKRRFIIFERNGFERLYARLIERAGGGMRFNAA